MLQLEAGYIDARPLTANSSKSSCYARPDHTFGSKADTDCRVYFPISIIFREDAIDIAGRAPVWVDRIWSIRDQAAVDDEEAFPMEGRQFVLSC